MQKITPFLWFDTQAEEAMNFYVSIFNDSKILSVTRYGEAGPGPKGTVMSATFQLEGQTFYALNGGPLFKFTPAISLFVNCETQQEVDDLWQKLSAGGREDRCGWLQDKYGLSWQIIPKVLGEMLGDKDPERAARVMQAMLKMGKIGWWCRFPSTGYGLFPTANSKNSGSGLNPAHVHQPLVIAASYGKSKFFKALRKAKAALGGCFGSSTPINKPSDAISSIRFCLLLAHWNRQRMNARDSNASA